MDPAQDGQDQPRQYHPSNAPSPLRVLVADAHPRVRHAIGSVLTREAGFALVGTVGHTDDLIDAVCSLQPDVVLLDITLPGSEPVATTYAIREISPATVVATNFHEPEDDLVRQVREAGAAHYVLKSDIPDGLLAVLRELGQRHAARRGAADGGASAA